ncbi:MAG: hypothetical protein U0640_13125 [Phycisphaerales bacterium]
MTDFQKPMLGNDDAGDVTPQLSEADQLAVGAWLARGGSAGLDANDDATKRVVQVGKLMKLLEVGGPEIHNSLIEKTLRNVGASGSASQTAGGAEFIEAELSEQDSDAFEAYMLANYEPGRVVSSLRPRAQQFEAIGKLLSQTPVHGREAELPETWPGAQFLIERTFQAAINTPRATPVETPVARGRGISWADLVSIAAVLLIGASVVWPVMSTYRTHSDRQGCEANFGSVASALGAYANDYKGSMPMASASLAGLPWWNVGKDPAQSNSANLYTLARTKYTGLPQLSCDGNGKCRRDIDASAMDWPSIENVSYSYFVMFGRARPNLAEVAKQPSQTIVLADRSPVILRAIAGQQIYPFENSPNHGGDGQNVLRLDGSAMWMATPVNRGDNIWLPANLEEVLREIQQQQSEGATTGAVPLLTRADAARQRAIRLQGTETPNSLEDSFVGP